MGGDDRKRNGPTKRFTREELAELARQARREPDEESPPAAAAPGTPTPMSRSQTLHDPLTTQLLAEVARRVQAELDERAAEDERDETAHPHTRRRRPT
jgi:hypothetical protein